MKLPSVLIKDNIDTADRMETTAGSLALQKSKTMTQAQGVDAVMNRHRLNAVAAPSNVPTWLVDLVNGDCGSNYISSSSVAAVAGYPNITVPAGFVRNLPVGVSFFGRAYSEPVLIKIASPLNN